MKNSHAIFDLQPSKEWNILIDETGSQFKKDETVKKDQLGKIVALLLPKETSLPPLPINWHAVNHREEIPEVISRINHSVCGIVGLSVDQMASLRGDLWDSCLRTLIDLILRLLPVTEPTVLRFFVENHSVTKQPATLMLRQTCKDALLQLAKTIPQKAGLISIEAKVIAKADVVLNGYVDAIANCWGSPKEESKALIQEWRKTCLWEKGSKRIIDILTGPTIPSEDDWCDLMLEYTANSSNIYLITGLNSLANLMSSSPNAWKHYLNRTREHLESKSINQKLLHAQIQWLRKSMPEDIELTPTLHLLWMTAELAEANHLGKILDDDFLNEFVPLCDDLVEEVPALVAWADLNLSVAYTNGFDFEGAQNVIDRWENSIPGHPGRQYYGQILSTQGQLSAFLGRQKEAVAYFDKALDYLVKNSDPDKGELDRLQTMAYKTIAIMDDTELPQQELDNALEAYLGLDPTRAAIYRVESTDEPYAHHILLRALQTGYYPEAMEAYLHKREAWKCGAYHPWELIEFYRGLMCDTDAERLVHLRKGYKIAMNGDVTMHVIGAVILGSILLWDDTVKESYADLVSQLRAKLPKLGERAQFLDEQPTKRRSPLELAKVVLPFNFR